MSQWTRNALKRIEMRKKKKKKKEKKITPLTHYHAEWQSATLPTSCHPYIRLSTSRAVPVNTGINSKQYGILVRQYTETRGITLLQIKSKQARFVSEWRQ